MKLFYFEWLRLMTQPTKTDGKPHLVSATAIHKRCVINNINYFPKICYS